MRKIERAMTSAVISKSNWSKSNTAVCYNENSNCSTISLHGHEIASYDHNTRAVKLDSCGYETVTTKSRLNALLSEVNRGARVFQKNFVWFVGKNKETLMFWDGMILCNEQSLQVV